MTGEVWYTILIALIALERLAEVAVAHRNARWAFAQGAVEVGQGHRLPMVALHIALLAGCLVEVWVFRPPFLPWLGWPMLGLVVAAQALRWWCILTLGRQWNIRVIVVPGLPLVRRGPYRWLRHPNYVAVILEGIALPLVHSAWVVALLFSIANAWLLAVRIRCEEKALQ